MGVLDTENVALRALRGKSSSVIRPELWRRIWQGRELSPPGRRTPS
jgi:hypothetical protein